MNTILSHENIEIPALLYGTAWKKEQTAAFVKQAIQAGFRGIDTACQPKHYSEKGIGDALQTLYEQNIVTRKELFIETKFTPKEGQDEKSIPYNPNDPLFKQVCDSFEISKQNLQTNYIDSLVLHSPLFPFKSLLSVWQAMESIYDKKEVGQLGISNCYELKTLQRLYEEARIKPAVVQNRFYEQSDYDKELRAWCKEKGIIYLAFWTLTANPHILSSATLFELARKYRCNPAQIFYRFLTQNGIVPLIGTTNTQHMKEDLSIFEFELSKKELASIEYLL